MIILKGNDSDILSIKLKDILLHVTDNVNWNLLWIEGVSIKKFNMLNFEVEVNESRDGYMINFTDLIKLSDYLVQLTEIVLIGDKNVGNLHKIGKDDEIKARCEYFIELVDSSYWEITSSNESFLKSIREHFSFEEY